MLDVNRLVVEPEALATESRPANLALVQITSEAVYREGHIDGAIFLPPQALISGQPPVPGKLPSVAQLEQVFGYLGYTPDTHYIVYDDEGGGWAGRFIWTLDVIGHRHYSYLNGGLVAWRELQLPLQTEPVRQEPTQPMLEINAHPIAEIEDILPHLHNQDFGVWDARSLSEYRGERIAAAKAGHIPGAVHCEWTELMDPDRGLRVRADAEIYLRQKGITRDKQWVTHCQSHHRSGFTYLVGKMLDFDIRAYHGSWAEWGNHPDTPVER